MAGRLALAITCILAALSIAAAFLMREDMGWITFLGPVTMASGIITSLKWPIYVTPRFHVLIVIAVTAMGVLWFVSMLRLHTVTNEYWMMLLALCGVSYIFRKPPKSETATG